MAISNNIEYNKLKKVYKTFFSDPDSETNISEDSFFQHCSQEYLSEDQAEMLCDLLDAVERRMDKDIKSFEKEVLLKNQMKRS